MGKSPKKTVYEKIGLPKNLRWGYLGILIFMIGDGVEQGWLSPYLLNHGLNMNQSATLFTVYGITIAISSWLSGVMADTFGVRKTMTIGLLLYLIGVAGFAGFGLANFNYPMMLLTYAIKGLGYPLFAYTMMVWIVFKTPQKSLSSAQGWFWFVFTGGLNVLGTFFASRAIVLIGEINTLWTAVFFALIGAMFTLVFNKYDQKISKHVGLSKFKELAKGYTIMKKEPKVLLGGIVRIINTTSQYAFPIFLPMYMMEHGFSLGEWLQIWGAVFSANIFFNLIFGLVGDRFGWQKTVIWFGAVNSAVTILLFFYSIQMSGNFYVVMACGMLWGIAVAGFVPLSALVPSLTKEEKGAAISVLNLGAGLSVFVGPALVGLLYGVMGSQGIIWVLAASYVLGAILTSFITLQEERMENSVYPATISEK